MSKYTQIVIVGAALSFAFAASAQKSIIYPAKGQSAEQQKKDEGVCHIWAKDSTGIDPAAVAQSAPPQETGPAVGGGERVGGAGQRLAPLSALSPATPARALLSARPPVP